VSNTWHIYGPPGTGKTARLAQHAKKVVQQYGSRGVLICSLTRTAKKEISTRDTYVAEDMIGTLHSHAYRALGNPTLAESHVDEWNDYCPHVNMRLSSRKKSAIDTPEDAGGIIDGDQRMGRINILRAQMIPADEWTDYDGPTGIRAFWDNWCSWKKESNYMDFTDLIEIAIRDVEKPPGDPTVMLGDEAQDWSKLEAKLFRDIWGKHVSTVVMAGDEDQCLFVWRGADPHIFSGHPIPEANIRTLEQSYRVPSKVHEYSQRWIRRITNRRDVIYKPRDGDGGDVRTRDDIKYADLFLAMEEIETHIKNFESTMILCSCSYMVNKVVHQLRERGLPFHNPYRMTNGKWNPLRSSKKHISTMDRLRAFSFPDNDNEGKTNLNRWSKDALMLWFPLLNSTDLLLSGTKKVVASGDFTVPTTADKWGHFFKHEGDILSMLQLNRGWLLSRAVASKHDSMHYPLQIINHGLQDTTPRVVVGTIHSVKGGEADHLYVFPDVSFLGMQGEYDDLVRMFYVAMTRAKQTLTLCGRSSKWAVEW